MSTTLNIHPELQSIKAHKLPLNRWALAPLQRFVVCSERDASTQVQAAHYADDDPKF